MSVSEGNISLNDKGNSVLFDITEFMLNPLRTGIQRVAYEIFRNWRYDLRLVPVRVTESSELAQLPDSTFDIISQFFSANEREAEKQRAKILAVGRVGSRKIAADEISHYCAIFNPEVFSWPPRVEFYERLAPLERTFFLVLDILPAISPHLFVRPFWLGAMPYLRLFRKIPNLSFISAATQGAVSTRLFRGHRTVGPVLPLGSDGLGTGEPCFSSDKKLFSVLGTLEPRKNHLQILRAFQGLWADGSEVKLTFVGRRGWLTEEEFDQITRCEAEQPCFKWMTDLSDGQVADIIRSSRATIFVSEIEGYGLPPMESLALGVPVIVSEKIPSVQMIEPLGQIRIHDVNPETISEAVMQMLDNDFAAKKYDEIESLELPMWSDMGTKIRAWILSNI